MGMLVGLARYLVRHLAVGLAGPAGNSSPLPAGVRRTLGLSPRRPQNAGLFTHRPERESASAAPRLPVRPVVCLLYIRWSARARPGRSAFTRAEHLHRHAGTCALPIPP